MDKQVRVVHVLGALHRGGAETFVMNVYRHIDKTKVQFDFIIHTNNDCAYRKEIEEMGGRIYLIPQFRLKKMFLYIRTWEKLLAEHPEWFIVHGHVRSTACIYMYIAKKAGRTVIAHSHSISNGRGTKGFVRDVMQYPVRYIADYFFACSEAAGKWMFGERIVRHNRHYKVVRNAINAVDFKYNRKYDEEIRKKFNLEDKKIIGTVGRLCDAKNPFFILDIFEAVYKCNQDTVLLWGGDGELREQIEIATKKKGLQGNVMLLGSVADVYKLYSAFDVFLFPSKWEGFGISLIEAQTAGLPCFVSENIPKEAVICEFVKQLSLEQGCNEWGNEIMKGLQYPSGRNRGYKDVINSGYDINIIVTYLQRLYLGKRYSI